MKGRYVGQNIRLVNDVVQQTKIQNIPGGGESRGLGPRNDVLTTCKAVALRGGQRIITVFFPQ